MVLVCHPKRFIFMKTRKTASTSVEMYFERFCVPEGTFANTEGVRQTISEVGIVGSRLKARRPEDKWYNHIGAREVRSMLGRATWDEYFKFATIRNPFSKLVSSYLFHNRLAYPETEAEMARVRQDFDRYVRGSWFKRRRWKNDRNIVAIGGKFQMDRLIRMEHLHEDVRSVCERLGVEWEPSWLPHKKKTGGEKKFSVKDFYDPRLEDFVRREYDWVFALIDYQMPER
jgi:hypothetical protein